MGIIITLALIIYTFALKGYYGYYFATYFKDQ